MFQFRCNVSACFPRRVFFVLTYSQRFQFCSIKIPIFYNVSTRLDVFHGFLKHFRPYSFFMFCSNNFGQINASYVFLKSFRSDSFFSCFPQTISAILVFHVFLKQFRPDSFSHVFLKQFRPDECVLCFPLSLKKKRPGSCC